MQAKDSIMQRADYMDRVIGTCGAVPRGEELPQVSSEHDVLVDIYSDALNMPHSFAEGYMNHQYFQDDSYDDAMIH